MLFPKVLLIDDDPDVLNVISSIINPLITLDHAQTIEIAIERLKKNDYSMILLDVYINDNNGMDLINDKSTPLDPNKTIVITSDQKVETEIRSHNLGFRDFLRKPFQMNLAKSLLDKHLNNIVNEISKEKKVGPFVINYMMHEVYSESDDGLPQKIDLTPKEFKIFCILIENKGWVLSREKIFENVWDTESESMSRTVDMHISALRSKLGQYGNLIKNKRSVGYYFEL